MNWSYIAGFFDGEGCVSKSNLKTYSISIAQSKKQDGALYVMANFLRANGVPCQIYGVTKSRTNPCSYLMITKQAALKRFVENVLSDVIVKKEKCLIALGQANISIQRMSERPKKMSSAVEMYRAGFSYMDCQKANNVDAKRLKKTLVSLGLPTRPRGTNQTFKALFQSTTSVSQAPPSTPEPPKTP